MATFTVLDRNQFWAQWEPIDINAMAHLSPNRERVAGADGALVSIVDDDDSVRKSLGRLFKSAGFRVETFPSAEDFLKFGSQLGTACLILDLRLTGMSGLDLQQQLAGENTRIPIVFVSAHNEDEARTQALQGGAVAFLGKPVNDKTLLDVVYSALK
jgi:FixJ family two-component response regulator